MRDRINYYIFLPLIFFAFFLEAAFLPSLLWGNFQPHLVLILIFASVFLSLSADFLFTAFSFGFLFDIYFGADFGIYTLSIVFAAMFACLIKEKFLKEEGFIKVAKLAIIAMFFYDLLYACLLFFVFGTQETFNLASVWNRTLLDCISAAILVFPMMRIISNGRE